MKENLKKLIMINKQLKNARAVHKKQDREIKSLDRKLVDARVQHAILWDNIEKAVDEQFRCFCEVLRDYAVELSKSQDDENKNKAYLNAIEDVFSNHVEFVNVRLKYTVEQKPEEAKIKFSINCHNYEISSNDRKKENVEKEKI